MRANSLDIQTLEIDGQGASGGSNPNIIINGGMTVWQRGTNKVNPDSSSEYNTVDRWRIRRANWRALTVGYSTSYAPPGSERAVYALRPSGDTYTNDEIVIVQQIESINVLPMRGKKITISFYFSQNAAAMAASANREINIVSGTGADESINSTTLAFTGATTLLNQSITPTSADTPEYFEYTTDIAVPNNASELAVQFRINPLATASSDEISRLGQVKLEIGEAATPYIERPISEEELLCFRYAWYWAVPPWTALGPVRCSSGSTAMPQSPRMFPVPMRVTPTLIHNSSGSVKYVKTDTQAGTDGTAGGITSGGGTIHFILTETVGGVNGDTYIALTNTPGQNLLFDAEL